MKELYRRNSNGSIAFWKAKLAEDKRTIVTTHGILGGKSIISALPITQKNPDKELQSKYNAKIKTGYKYLSEVRDDNTCPPVEDTQALIKYLTTYLPIHRDNGDGILLPMLAKVYYPNVFNKISSFLGQWKINGLRCFITAHESNDIFKPIRLRFQSREGEIWDKLYELEDYLLTVIPKDFIGRMIEEGIALDGEVYLPGYKVNAINSFIKTRCEQTKLLQFWLYDVSIEDKCAYDRYEILRRSFNKYTVNVFDINDHLNNIKPLVLLPNYIITSNKAATITRDKFIQLGFEGLIIRDPNAEYGYGTRNNKMLKYKSKTDGKFKVIDIYKEPKRDLPILLCENDINDETFETRLSSSHEHQQSVLAHKESYIGKYVFISFGERSGVSEVPFHVQEVYFLE